MSMPRALALFVAASALAAGCTGFSAVYPPRPAETPGEAIADPTPSRVVMHATITSAGLKSALEAALPTTGAGTFPLMGSERKYTWTREPMKVRFTQGRLSIELHVAAVADLPVSNVNMGMDFQILAEPVITSEYVAKLQSVELKVTSDDRLVKVADAVAGVLGKIRKEVGAKLDDFSYDLRPLLGEAYQRVAKPIDLPLGGEAHGCAVLKVLGVEAGPTVIADGMEKDLAMVIAPSVTIPCAEEEIPKALPPLANVATIQPGPFTVSIPIAAKYDELAKAMNLAFTDGKLFFSKDFPELYMEKPEVYAAKDQLVLKLHLTGPIHKMGIDTTLDGDIFMSGHPTVEDNELRVPDLEPTIETTGFLLTLKSMLDGKSIRDQARAALRLDIGDRLKSVKQKLTTDLAFGNGQGCLKAQANKIEVSGVHVHAAYLRVYVTVNASASVYLPCPG
ncbi:MAG: DUF4403 family protein [Minicystis sp.]